MVFGATGGKPKLDTETGYGPHTLQEQRIDQSCGEADTNSDRRGGSRMTAAKVSRRLGDIREFLPKLGTGHSARCHQTIEYHLTVAMEIGSKPGSADVNCSYTDVTAVGLFLKIIRKLHGRVVSAKWRVECAMQLSSYPNRL